MPEHRLTRNEADRRWAEVLDKAPPFAEALGAQLRQTRAGEGRTIEDVAQSARQLGLPWHRPTVGQVERGKRGLSAAELFLLPLVYGRPLRDLLPPVDQTVWLTDETAVYGAELHRVLDDGYDPGRSGYFRPGSWHRRTRMSKDEVMEAVQGLAAKESNWPHGALLKHMGHPDEAETKAAKRLDTTPQYVAYAARELWGRGLTAERDARLAERSDTPDTPRALQAARGHITRALITELEPRIRHHEERRGQPEGIDWEGFRQGEEKADG